MRKAVDSVEASCRKIQIWAGRIPKMINRGRIRRSGGSHKRGIVRIHPAGIRWSYGRRARRLFVFALTNILVVCLVIVFIIIVINGSNVTDRGLLLWNLV